MSTEETTIVAAWMATGRATEYPTEDTIWGAVWRNAYIATRSSIGNSTEAIIKELCEE